jgi:hypothetical protein
MIGGWKSRNMIGHQHLAALLGSKKIAKKATCSIIDAVTQKG